MLLSPGGAGTVFVRDNLPLTTDFIEDIGRPGKPTVYFFGRMEYEPLGRKRHYVEFCAKIFRFNIGRAPDTPSNARPE